MLSRVRGYVFDIQRYCVSDGPGIRTCVFLKGCPLACVWCHNPESQSFRPQLSLNPLTCIACGECAAICRNHTFSPEEHSVRREACTTCGKCAAACPSGALQIIGRPMTVEAIMEEVMKDLPFFRVSKGGLTVTGGEPLAQPEFLAALLRAAHDAGLSTCVETSGYAPWECFESILNCTDYFLYDIKESDPKRHQIYTGAGPERIWDNLGRLNASGAQMILRCPIIPGFNDRIDHFAQIGRLAQAHAHVLRVEVEPYHPLGISKARNIGMICQMQPIPLPTDEDTGNWIAQIAKWTDKPVRRA